ncbi:MAG: anti-sigma regulatory factor (Ser/Thr protein kinase) [Candidatus Aminicenantes bacterium]|nr:anti-sigma regulatory factor (Ser/Thr protein kinase) [Candidatus Aminicenantes bacterium]
MNTLTIGSKLRELDKVRAFLKTNLAGLDLNEEEVYKVELSLVEMCSNIMRYAYPGKTGEIVVSAWHEAGKFYLEVRDSGVPFDPRQVKKPTLEEMICREQMGGLGIFLARKLMDGFLYRREDDQNVLVMYKKAKLRRS